MGVFRNLRSLFRPAQTYVYGGDWGVHVANMDAATLYRTQPNLRAVISFLADNAAQVPLKVHERAGQNDRPRVTDSPAALLLRQPNPDMTPFEFRRWMYSDLLLYERFLMLVLPNADSDSGWEMRPVPAPWIVGYNGASPFAPESIDIASPGNAPVRVPADKFILFHGYDPTDPMRQYSRISALRETLHEQVESNTFRRQMWQRGGRFNAYLTRPKDVQPWSDEGFERFRQTWRASWAGADAGEGGGMPILEDGMEIRTVQFNSRDAQWADSVKLSREDVAGVYHVNPALIWPGSGQTYASAKDNARALYNDCLAPTLMQATDRLNMALLPRIGEDPSHYVVYDITIKTQGSLEERIAAMQTACGVPFMTRNEVRGMLDLPSIDGGDELIVPLNVAEGGLASIHDTDPGIERYNAAPTREAGCACCQKATASKGDEAPASFTEGGEPVYPDQVSTDELGVTDESPKALRKASGRPKKSEAEDMAAVYKAFFERQAKSVLPKISSSPNPGDGGDEPTWWNSERWNRELADDLYEKAIKVTDAAGTRTAEKLWGDQETGAAYDSARTEAYVRSMCERRAQMVNAATLKELQKALSEDPESKARGRRVSEEDEWPDEDEDGPLKDTPGGVFEHASENRSHTAGYAFATALVGWAMLESCRQNAGSGEGVFKTWEVNSSNPRSSHAAMNGETVPYDEPFSNGMKWPGDADAADASEVANCQCSLGIVAGGSGGDSGADRVPPGEEGWMDEETASAVAHELNLGEEYQVEHVCAAYMKCQTTIGQEAAEWSMLDKAQRAALIAEMKTRDSGWVATGEIRAVSYKGVSRAERRRMHDNHEADGHKYLRSQGFRVDALPTLGDAVANIDLRLNDTLWELKTIHGNGASLSRRFDDGVSKWERLHANEQELDSVPRIVVDNRYGTMSDKDAIERIRQNLDFFARSSEKESIDEVLLITSDERLLRVTR